MMRPTISRPAAPFDQCAQYAHNAGARQEAPANRSQSALRLAREAIARWRGAPLPTGALASNGARVSPQAVWLAQASADLQRWIDSGGFSHEDMLKGEHLPPLACPVMYRLPSTLPTRLALRNASACID